MSPFSSLKILSVSTTNTSESSPRRTHFCSTKSDAMDTAHQVVLPSSSLHTSGTRLQDNALTAQDGYAEFLEDENMSWGMAGSTRNNKRFGFSFFRR